MGWSVFVDFDGTITLDDLTNAILDRFADSSWREIETEWEAGLIGSRACMARQVALIRAHPHELDSFVEVRPWTHISLHSSPPAGVVAFR